MSTGNPKFGGTPSIIPDKVQETTATKVTGSLDYATLYEEARQSRGAGKFATDQVGAARKIVAFLESKEPTSMDLVELLEVGSLVDLGASLIGRGAGSRSGSILEPVFKFNIELSKRLTKAVEDGRARIVPTGDQSLNDPNKLIEAGYEFVLMPNSKNYVITNPGTPETEALRKWSQKMDMKQQPKTAQ